MANAEDLWAIFAGVALERLKEEEGAFARALHLRFDPRYRRSVTVRRPGLCRSD